MALSAEKTIPVTILRPTLIYGAGLDSNITRLADVVRRFGFLAIYPPANGGRQPVQVMDLATAGLNIIYNPTTFGKAYNLGGSQALPYHTMLLGLFNYMGKSPRIYKLRFLPTLLNVLGKLYGGNINAEMAHRMNQNLVFDIQSAIEDFRYNPKGYLEGDIVI